MYFLLAFSYEQELDLNKQQAMHYISCFIAIKNARRGIYRICGKHAIEAFHYEFYIKICHVMFCVLIL